MRTARLAFWGGVRGVFASRGTRDLLVDVTAILTLVALGPAAEAFGVPQNFVVAASTAFETSRATAPASAPFIGPTPDLAPTPDLGPTPPELAPQAGLGPDLQVTTLSGIQLLEQLVYLTPAQIEEFVDARPDAIRELLAHPPVARDVTMWWGTLTPVVRSGLLAASPELVGNLDGVPFEVRDVANRVFLDQTMHDLRTVIDSDAGRTMIDHAEQQLNMLEAIADSLDTKGVDSTLTNNANPGAAPAAADAERTLLSLDVSGQGRAAIVLGDLRTADYVTYLVPGMFFTIENQMGDWTNAAAELYSEQVAWLELLDRAESGGTPTALGAGQSSTAASLGIGGSEAATPTVATIAWIGYHTPNLTNVGAIDNALEGRDSLASAIEGLQALRADNEPYVTVVAHSYGSTAALMALTEDSFEIDALAMVGSPGSDAQSVDDLHVRDGNVWVGEAAWDPVPNSSFFGSDPGAPEYGAKKLGVDGGTDVITDRPLTGSIGHNEYFGAGSQSMRNLALIGIDRGEFVSDGSAADASKTLDLLG